MYFTKDEIKALDEKYAKSTEIVNRFKIIEYKGSDFIPGISKQFTIFDELLQSTHTKFNSFLIAGKMLKKLGFEQVKIDKDTGYRSLYHKT